MPHPPGSSSARPPPAAAFPGLLRRPFRSLPSRILLSVFGAAVVSSLVVTLVSTSSIEAFLRAEIDRKFPATLQASAERIDLWYSQRALDVETFGRSAGVVEPVTELAGAGAAVPGAREALARQLARILERFPHYEALLVLDADGAELARAGRPAPLPESLRQRLARAQAAGVGDVHEVDGRALQAASAPVADPAGRRLGTLHAFVRLAALAPVLAPDDLGATVAVYVVDRRGEALVQSPGTSRRARYPRPLPAADAAARVQDYSAETGEHVVGSALRLPRFGWTIAVEERYEDAFAPVVAILGRILALNLGVVALFGLVAWQFARSIVRPIQALSAGARRIAEGEVGVVVPLPVSRDEIEVLTRVFNEMSRRLEADQLELGRSRLEIEAANERLRSQNQELQRMNEVLEQLSITDGLTRLHNHRFFHDQLRRECRRAARTGEPLALVLIDIDEFKPLNDRFGHAAGDAVLRQIGEVMNRVVRETDVLARYGGEEFALIAPRSDLAGAAALGEKIRLAVSETPFGVGGDEPVRITVSVGVAQFAGDQRGFFNAADRALYRAKASGKDCVASAEAPA